MKKTMVVIGLVSAISLTAATAFAWGPGFGHGMGYGPGAAAATLSAERRATIQKIQADRFTEMTKVRSELFAKRAELQTLFCEPTLDAGKVAAKHKEITALQAQMQEQGLAARLAVAQVLTPEQRAQLPAFGTGMGPGAGPGMGMGRMMGPHMGVGPRW